MMVAREDGATATTATVRCPRPHRRRRRPVSPLARLLGAAGGWALLLLALSAAPRYSSAEGMRAGNHFTAGTSVSIYTHIHTCCIPGYNRFHVFAQDESQRGMSVNYRA